MGDALDLLQRHDSHAALRRKLHLVADVKDEYCGIPMPLDGENLVVEPSYPYAGISDIGKKPDDENALAGYKVRNTFHSTRRGLDVHVVEEVATGKITFAAQPAKTSAATLIRTMGCSVAWGIEQERNALALLGTLLKHVAFKHYLLTGTFIERSTRSGVWYMFRKLRPTLAIVSTRDGTDTKVLAALCMHPIAYYSGSWAGAMCPTDDVVAHLMLCRADEPMFWRRCNQHPAWSHLAGI